MAEQSFMRVEEVAQELGVSKSYAYKIVQKLNQELKEKGYLTISGRVNRKYFQEKACYRGLERKAPMLSGLTSKKSNICWTKPLSSPPSRTPMKSVIRLL